MPQPKGLAFAEGYEEARVPGEQRCFQQVQVQVQVQARGEQGILTAEITAGIQMKAVKKPTVSQICGASGVSSGCTWAR